MGDIATRNEYIRKAENQLCRLLFDFESLKNDIRAGLAHSQTGDVDTRIQLLESVQLISAKTFSAMIAAGEDFIPMYVHEMWDLLVRAGVFVRQFRGEGGETALADHTVARGDLLAHLRYGTFVNLFHPPSHLHEYYAPALVAIDVELADGGPARGSGFVVQTGNSRARWLFTCLHNVDLAKVRVTGMTSAKGQELEVGHPLRSDRIDFAAFPLLTDIASSGIVLKNGGRVFDEVFTLGFPQVPGADSILLGHRGEINGRADLYVQKCPALIVSNLVSPGSSGGPVLDREGRCLGMTIEWLEGQWGEEKTRFSAALPSSALLAEFQRMSALK